jgi:hypothetical protein
VSTLVTFPGRAGDILWALPSVRAVSEALGEPVDFLCTGEFQGLCELIGQQPYIASATATDAWGLTPPDEWRSPVQADRFDHVVELGYRGWPQVPLPLQTYSTLAQYWPDGQLPPLPPMDLHRPWITAPPLGSATVSVGFTEEWFELKLGLVHCLRQAWMACQAGCSWTPVMVPHGRWETEGGIPGCDWRMAAQLIAASQVFVGCCSAPHVLAVALGVPVVLVEPSEARQNPIFYPLGMNGPQVMIVRGGDGQPTWDARAVAATVARVREGRR